METVVFQGVSFSFNEDFSADVIISAPGQPDCVVPMVAITALVARQVLASRMKSLGEATIHEVLGIIPNGRKPVARKRHPKATRPRKKD